MELMIGAFDDAEFRVGLVRGEVASSRVAADDSVFAANGSMERTRRGNGAAENGSGGVNQTNQ